MSRAQILEFGHHSSLTDDARPFVGLLCRQLWLPLTQEVRTIGTQTHARRLVAAAAAPAASMRPLLWCHWKGRQRPRAGQCTLLVAAAEEVGNTGNISLKREGNES